MQIREPWHVAVIQALRRYRWTEIRLLLIPFMILLIGMTQLQLIDNGPAKVTKQSLPPLDSLVPAIGLIIALVITHVILQALLADADQLLLPLAGLLTSIGVLMALRLGPDVGDPSLGTRQLMWAIVGLFLCIMTILVTRSTRWLRLYKYTWALLGLLLVAITLVHALHGANFNSPTHDQLNLGPSGFSIQPSEFLKICLVIFFAAYLDENYEILAKGGPKFGPFRLPPAKQLAPLLVMLGLSLLIFVGLRELGLALLIFGIFLSMIYLGSGRLIYIISALVLFFAGAYICYLIFGYVRTRVEVAINPWPYAQDASYQIVQGLIALASGGIFGAGLGLGHPAIVPAVQTDYIFAAIGDELGLAGIIALISIYMLLVARGFAIAINAHDRFHQLLAAGLTVVFAIQTIVIIAGNLKLIPLTGIPLPFISYGGSSLVANFIMIGLLLRISTNRHQSA
jgi:cell division protein FtsW (lipid II flippase)